MHACDHLPTQDLDANPASGKVRNLVTRKRLDQAETDKKKRFLFYFNRHALMVKGHAMSHR